MPKKGLGEIYYVFVIFIVMGTDRLVCSHEKIDFPRGRT